MAIKKEKGLTTEDKGTYIPPEKRAPDVPGAIKMSKAQFIEYERKRKERELKLKEYEEQLKAEKAPDVPTGPGPDAKEEKSAKSNRGRPKQIK